MPDAVPSDTSAITAQSAAVPAANTATTPAGTPSAPVTDTPAAPVAPVVDLTYELTAPADAKVDPADIKGISDWAKASGLTKVQAEALLARDLKLAQDYSAADQKAIADQLAGWKSEMEKDPEFGGLRLQETIAASNKALTHFAGKEADAVHKFMTETGANNHPMVVRLLARIGKSLSEDRQGSSGIPTQSTPSASMALFGNAVKAAQ